MQAFSYQPNIEAGLCSYLRVLSLFFSVRHHLSREPGCGCMSQEGNIFGEENICKDKIMGGGYLNLLLEGKFIQMTCIPGQTNILLWPGCKSNCHWVAIPVAAGLQVQLPLGCKSSCHWVASPVTTQLQVSCCWVASPVATGLQVQVATGLLLGCKSSCLWVASPVASGLQVQLATGLQVQFAAGLQVQLAAGLQVQLAPGLQVQLAAGLQV